MRIEEISKVVNYGYLVSYGCLYCYAKGEIEKTERVEEEKEIKAVESAQDSPGEWAINKYPEKTLGLGNIVDVPV